MKNIILSLVLVSFFEKSISQIGINATNTAPDTKAMLDISSTSKGVLIPRMTTAQRIAIAPTATQTGLTVFDTNTRSQWFYDGTVWKEMAGGFSLPYSGTNNSGSNALDINNTVGRAAYFQSPNSLETMRVYNSGIGNAITIDGHLNLMGNLKANGVGGTAGQILTSTGSAIAWSNTSAPPTTYAIGDFAQGGVVFYLNAAGTHGKVISVADINDVVWSNITSTEIGNMAKSTINGAGNTVSIVQQDGHQRSAASLCADFAYGGYDDWYLPSINEMYLVFIQRVAINSKAISNEGENFAIEYYWTSSESSSTHAKARHFGTGVESPYLKSDANRIRPIRAF